MTGIRRISHPYICIFVCLYSIDETVLGRDLQNSDIWQRVHGTIKVEKHFCKKITWLAVEYLSLFNV
jgi:hypothetical protein